MEYEEARQRIFYHSAFGHFDGTSKARWTSIVNTLLDAKAGGYTPDISQAVTDLITCLESVNRYWNGDMPSSSMPSDHRQPDRNVTYAMAAILSTGIECFLAWLGDAERDQSTVYAMGQSVWRISIAWDAVLAGDIDSIQSHVELERWARQNAV